MNNMDAMQIALEAKDAENEALRAKLAEWETWSNTLATILPEDAETWPGVNPDAAQEAIIEQALTHLVNTRPCTYEPMWTDEVGTVPVCIVHGNNSRHAPEFGEHRPCLTIDPYPSS